MHRVTQGRDKGFRGDGVGIEVYYKTWAMLGLAHTPSVIALGCLDEGDERGEGQGLLLESTWLRARYGYHDKVESRDEMQASTISAGRDLNTLEQGGQDY